MSLAKDNCKKPAWHVPNDNVKIVELRKCGSGLNWYKQTRCYIKRCSEPKIIMEEPPGTWQKKRQFRVIKQNLGVG